MKLFLFILGTISSMFIIVIIETELAGSENILSVSYNLTTFNTFFRNLNFTFIELDLEKM